MVEWLKTEGLVDYNIAVSFMETRASEIAANKNKELVWLLEHPPLYTAGASANENDLLDKDSFPVYRTRRGGQFTYHGPGQRVAYIMLDLNKRGRDVRAFVEFLEKWIIATLKEFDRVSFHGISININPNLEHFSGIIPCGEADFGVTSINELGVSVTMDDFDRALKNNFFRLCK